MNEENQLLGQTFELDDKEDFLTEEDFLHALSIRISHMLEYEPNLLFSTLYRLDVSERKINLALHNGDPDIHMKLAKLVLDRQKIRMETKKKYGRQEMIDPDLSF